MRVFALLGLLALSSSASSQDTGEAVEIEILTELGSITVAVYPNRASNTVENFLRYVDGGFFEGGSFHRTVHAENQPTDSVRIAVIQGDIRRDRGGERFGPIELERTNLTGLKHLDGTISMARSGPDTATSSFFICVGDQPELDYGGKRNADGQGFAAFGKVLEGMDVVRAILRSPAQGQTLTPPITILGIHRIGA